MNRQEWKPAEGQQVRCVLDGKTYTASRIEGDAQGFDVFCEGQGEPRWIGSRQLEPFNPDDTTRDTS